MMTACGKDYCRACEASEGRPEALDQFIASAMRESQKTTQPRPLVAGAWLVIIAIMLIIVLSQ